MIEGGTIDVLLSRFLLQQELISYKKSQHGSYSRYRQPKGTILQLISCSSISFAQPASYRKLRSFEVDHARQLPARTALSCLQKLEQTTASTQLQSRSVAIICQKWLATFYKLSPSCFGLEIVEGTDGKKCLCSFMKLARTVLFLPKGTATIQDQHTQLFIVSTGYFLSSCYTEELVPEVSITCTLYFPHPRN